MHRSLLFFILPFSLTFAVGCGSQGSPPPPPPPTITSVSVLPNNASLLVKSTQQFAANVQGTGNFNSAASWYVNNVQGGNSTVGTITANGFYTAPNAVPSPSNVTVLARSVQDSSRAYVLSASTLTAATQEYCWIDVYDLSDPIHPVWIDAAEALKSETSPFECSGNLYAYGGFVYELIWNAETPQGCPLKLRSSNLRTII